MLTQLPSKIEKAALEHFSDAFKDRPSVQCEIKNASSRLVGRSLEQKLQPYADCFFIAREIKGKRRIFLCASNHLARLFDEVVLNFDIIAAMHKDGAVTFSADEAIADRSLELHLRGSGVFATEVEKLAKEFSGVLY